MKGLVIEFGKKPKAPGDESGAEGESAESDEYGMKAKTKAAEAIMAAAKSGDATALVDALDTYLAACE